MVVLIRQLIGVVLIVRFAVQTFAAATTVFLVIAAMLGCAISAYRGRGILWDPVVIPGVAVLIAIFADIVCKRCLDAIFDLRAWHIRRQLPATDEMRPFSITLRSEWRQHG